MKITIYVKAGANIPGWIRTLNKELALARNIKDKATGILVGQGLRSLKDALRTVGKRKEVRRNGVVLFADGSDVRVEVPPQPMNYSAYYCGREFLTEPLDELLDDAKGPWTGIIVIDAKEAAIGIGRGDAVVTLWHKYSSIMGKHNAGGQSARRFARGREEQLKEWRRKILVVARDLWRGQHITEVLIGGPGFEKQRLASESDAARYKRSLISSEYTDEYYGLREAWQRWRTAQDGGRR